jgi:hypothetical protein
MSNLPHPDDLGAIIGNTHQDDIPKIVDLQKESFPYLASCGNMWRHEELDTHLRIFRQGQFFAVESDDLVIGSATTLKISLIPEYAEYTWKEITADGMICNHNPNGDSLYGADVIHT